jgi:hypothetical protein
MDGGTPWLSKKEGFRVKCKRRFARTLRMGAEQTSLISDIQEAHAAKAYKSYQSAVNHERINS